MNTSTYKIPLTYNIHFYTYAYAYIIPNITAKLTKVNYLSKRIRIKYPHCGILENPPSARLTPEPPAS